MAFKDAPPRDLRSADNYPVDIWFNGEQWLLRYGVHYQDCKPKLFCNDLKQHAKRLGLSLIIQRRNRNIMLQARQANGRPIQSISDKPVQPEPYAPYVEPDGPDDSAPAGIWY